MTETRSPFLDLTPRECEVARMLATGSGTSDVAEALAISVKTAATHRTNLFRKLGCRNNVELAHAAIRHGFVPLNEREAKT